jgi:lysozyme
MSLWDDLQAAKTLWDKEQQEFDAAKAERDAAKAAYDQLLAQGVRGGPDLSHWNGAVDFAQVKNAGYEFVIQRTSDGDVRDRAWFGLPPGEGVGVDFSTHNRYNAIKQAGLSVGVYHFARIGGPANNNRGGKSEAAMALYFSESRGWGKTGDLPLAYDFEDLNGQTSAKAAQHVVDFCRAYDYLKGHRPIIYTNPGTWNQVEPNFSAEDKTWLGGCPLWLADWTPPADAVSPWGVNWSLWQFTKAGVVPGVVNPCDLNRFSGSQADLETLRL